MSPGYFPILPFVTPLRGVTRVFSILPLVTPLCGVMHPGALCAAVGGVSWRRATGMGDTAEQCHQGIFYTTTRYTALRCDASWGAMRHDRWHVLGSERRGMGDTTERCHQGNADSRPPPPSQGNATVKWPPPLPRGSIAVAMVRGRSGKMRHQGHSELEQDKLCCGNEWHEPMPVLVIRGHSPFQRPPSCNLRTGRQGQSIYQIDPCPLDQLPQFCLVPDTQFPIDPVYVIGHRRGRYSHVP